MKDSAGDFAVSDVEYFLYLQDLDPFSFDDDDDDDHLFSDVCFFLFAHVRWNSGYFCTLIPRFSLLFDRVLPGGGPARKIDANDFGLEKENVGRDRHENFESTRFNPDFSRQTRS